MRSLLIYEVRKGYAGWHTDETSPIGRRHGSTRRAEQEQQTCSADSTVYTCSRSWLVNGCGHDSIGARDRRYPAVYMHGQKPKLSSI